MGSPESAGKSIKFLTHGGSSINKPESAHEVHMNSQSFQFNDVGMPFYDVVLVWVITTCHNQQGMH